MEERNEPCIIFQNLIIEIDELDIAEDKKKSLIRRMNKLYYILTKEKLDIFLLFNTKD
jgi:hypothetical protein